jgi:hypothetical protein
MNCELIPSMYSVWMFRSKSWYLWTKTLESVLNMDERRNEHGAYLSTISLICSVKIMLFSYFYHLSIQVLLSDGSGFLDGFAFALTSLLLTENFGSLLNGCYDLLVAKGGLYLEGDDGGRNIFKRRTCDDQGQCRGWATRTTCWDIRFFLDRPAGPLLAHQHRLCPASSCESSMFVLCSTRVCILGRGQP